jgi:guanylate kinase
MKKGKVVIFSAPSGSGKSTLVRFLMKQDSSFGFSVSATSRPPRGEEKHGVDYYFFTADEFRARIAADEFSPFAETVAVPFKIFLMVLRHMLRDGAVLPLTSVLAAMRGDSVMVKNISTTWSVIRTSTLRLIYS